MAFPNSNQFQYIANYFIKLMASPNSNHYLLVRTSLILANFHLIIIEIIAFVLYFLGIINFNYLYFHLNLL